MDGWLLMAGALWWSPAVWSANEGLGHTAGCATPINLARSAGFFWGAGAEWKASSGQQPKSAVCVCVCDGAVNCLLSSLSVCLSQQSLADGARSCRVLQGIAVCCGSVRNKRAAGDVVCL